MSDHKRLKADPFDIINARIRCLGLAESMGGDEAEIIARAERLFAWALKLEAADAD